MAILSRRTNMRRLSRLTALLLLMVGIAACNEEDCGLATLALYGDDPDVRVFLINADTETGNAVHLLTQDDFGVPTQETLVQFGGSRLVNLGPVSANSKFTFTAKDKSSLDTITSTSPPCTYTGKAHLAAPTVTFRYDVQKRTFELVCGSGW